MKLICKIAILILFIQLLSCTDDKDKEPVILSSENFITSFSLQINNEEVHGEINQSDKTITFNTKGANLSSLIPNIVYSDKATIKPGVNVSQNFNNEVAYTIIAENGDAVIYRVIVNNTPLSTENKILSFSVKSEDKTIQGTISHELKEIYLEFGNYNKENLVPDIEISELAIISPGANQSQNFSNDLKYEVTAENGEIAVYSIVIDKPIIDEISSIGGTFTNNPVLLYAQAEIRISGVYLDMENVGADFYLYDGINKYYLEIDEVKQNPYENYIYSSITSSIPKTVPTFATYKLVYETGSFRVESETYIDISNEGVPTSLSLNQDEYSRNDILIMDGENLPDMIAIPSNGSVFLIQNSSNYDLTVNADKTQLKLTLDYYYLFPSYFGRDEAELKVITTLGPSRRAGKTIKTYFK